MRRQSSLARYLRSAAVAAMFAVTLGGCQTISDVTGSLTSKADSTDPHRVAELAGERYRANPKDADAALAYGQALRATGQRSQAAAMLEQATIANPGNKPLLAAYGRALADNGDFQTALDVLSRAHTPENPDWRILSVQGAVLDQLGRHDEARGYYTSALRIKPGEPSVLSNLGLSYMLSKDLPKAERNLASGLCEQQDRLTDTAKSRAGGWSTGSLRRSRRYREGGSAAGRGGSQCRISQADAEPQGQPARAPRPNRYRWPRSARNKRFQFAPAGTPEK